MTGAGRTGRRKGTPCPSPACRKPGAAGPDVPLHPPASALAAFVTSWQLALEAAGKSPKTVRSYPDSVKALHAVPRGQDMPADVEEVDAEHIRAFLLVRGAAHVGRLGRRALPQPAGVLRLAGPRG